MRDDTRKDKNISIEAKVNEGIRLALGYTDCEDAVNAYIKYIGELLQADRAYIFEKNEKFQDCNTYEWAADGVTPEMDSLQELDHELCREWYENFEDNECIIIRNVEDIKNTNPNQYEVLARQNIQSLVAAPLYDEGRVIGFYGVDNFKADTAEWTSDILKFMSYFIVSCIKRRDLIKELLEAGAHDHLTGLGNRYSFNRQIERWNKSDNIVCVVLDVNNLKLCNDRYGHEEGDRLIKDAAYCISSSFGKIGKCFRVGGDEFYVLIKNCDSSVVKQKETEFARLIEEANVGRKTRLSIAYGYRMREPGEAIEHLVNRSDEAMYEMKYSMKQQFPVYCEERLKNYRMVLEILSKSTDDYMYMFDVTKGESHFFGDVSKRFSMCDNGRPTVSLEELFSIVHPDDVQELQADFMKLGTGESMVHNMNYRWVNRDGEPVWINCRGKVINDDKGKPFVMIGRVSDTALKYMVNLLTGLFNESKYFKDMNSIIASGNTGHLLFIRINDLNNINLQNGREYGDKIIKNLALVLEIVAKKHKMYHMESVYFCVCLDGSSKEEVQELYDRITEKKYNVYTTVACAVPYGPNSDENRLFAYGKQTMLQAQLSGDSYEEVFFASVDK